MHRSYRFSLNFRVEYLFLTKNLYLYYRLYASFSCWLLLRLTKLNVGRQKKTREITDYTAVSDSIQYTDQENNYSFVAKYDGTYRFELSDVPNGTDLEMGIYNRVEATIRLMIDCLEQTE